MGATKIGMKGVNKFIKKTIETKLTNLDQLKVYSLLQKI